MSCYEDEIALRSFYIATLPGLIDAADAAAVVMAQVFTFTSILPSSHCLALSFPLQIMSENRRSGFGELEWCSTIVYTVMHWL